MSQYPNDLSGGGGVMLRGNRLGLSTDTGGIRENIGVQGLEPLPVDTSGMQVANELAQSLGLFAQLGGTIDQVQRRKQAAQAQEDAKVEQFDRGAAVRAAANTYAELEPAIRERKMIAAVDDKDLGSYVENLIQSRTDKGMAPAWKDEYNKQLHGRLLNAFGQQRAGIQKDAKETALQSLKDAATGARTTVEIMQSVLAAKDTLGLSELEAQAAITVPALRLAAAQGDSDKFEQATFALQGMFADEVAQGQTRLDAKVQSNELEKQKANEREFSAWFNADPQNLPPIEVAFDRLDKTDMTPADRDQWRRALEAEQSKAQQQDRQTIEDMIGSALSAGEPDKARKIIESSRGKLGDEWGSKAIQGVQSYQAKVLDRQSEEYEARWKQNVTQEIMAVSMRAYETGGDGIATYGDTHEVVLPNNKTARFTTEEAVNLVRPQVFAAIDQKYAKDPQRALAEKDRWLTSNGVEAHEWKQRIDAAAASSTQDALTDPERSKSSVAGFQFYRQLKAQNPATAHQHAGERARKLFDTAESLLAGSRTIVNGTMVESDPARALLDAGKILADLTYPRREAQADDAMNRKDASGSDKTALSKAADRVTGGGVPTGELMEVMRLEARPLMIGGKSADDALAEVVERFKKTTVIVGGSNNRRAINTQFKNFNDSFRRDLPAFSEIVLDRYHAEEGKDHGYAREDLSMNFDPRTGVFAIVDRNNKVVKDRRGVRTVLFNIPQLHQAAVAARKDKILGAWKKETAFEDPGAAAFIKNPGLIQ